MASKREIGSKTASGRLVSSVKGEWSDAEKREKVGFREIKVLADKDDAGSVVTYKDARFDKVSTIAEAMTLLKIKDGKRAVRIMLRGFNLVSRKDAIATEEQARDLAERADITLDAARKRIRGEA